MKIRDFLTFFIKIRVQLTVGLLFFSMLCSAQLDTAFWSDFKEKKATINHLLGVDLDSALKESKILLKTVKEPIDSITWSSLIMVQGHIYSDLGDYERANAKYIETARIREQLQDKSHAGAAYHSLASLYFHLSQYDQVFPYAKKAIQLYSLNQEYETLLASLFDAMALSKHHLGESDSALFYFNHSLELYNKIEKTSVEDYARLYGNMGLAYLGIGDYDLGVEYFKKSLNYRTDNTQNVRLSRQYIHLAFAFIKKEEFDSAKVYVQKAELEAPEALTISDKRTLLNYKIDIASNDENSEDIIKFSREYRILTDTIVAKRIKSNIQDAQTKYDVEKKDAAIRLGKEESEKLEAQNTAKNRLLIAAVAVFLLLLLTGIYYYRSTKQKEHLSKLKLEVKNKELNEILSNQENEVFSSILKGQEKERERIAMDLHDRLGGTLAALRLSLKKPTYHIEKDDFSILETAITEVRSISHNLSTGLVNKYGLNEAVTKLFSTLENSKGIQFSVFFHPDTAKLGQGVGIELYRVVQELVSNTLKHAEASEVKLKTSVENWKFSLLYEDNGKGFDINKKQGGIGMENIKTRVQNIDGKLEVKSTIGAGSKFLVTISLNPLKG